MATSNSLTDNYNININKIFGDATTETSTSGSENTSWHLAKSSFVGIYYSYDYPFFQRGGFYDSDTSDSFSFYSSFGNFDGRFSFRVSLTV